MNPHSQQHTSEQAENQLSRDGRKVAGEQPEFAEPVVVEPSPKENGVKRAGFRCVLSRTVFIRYFIDNRMELR